MRLPAEQSDLDDAELVAIQGVIRAVHWCGLTELDRIFAYVRARFDQVEKIEKLEAPFGMNAKLARELRDGVKRLQQAGENKIHAIKYVRDIANIDLKSAKDFVDQIYKKYERVEDDEG